MRDDRAVSEVLGYVLVFSLVVTTIGVVSVAGLGGLQETRNAEQLNNAERAFDLLHTNIEDVAIRNAPSRSTEIRLADAQLEVIEPTVVAVRGVDDDAPANNFSESYDVRPIRYRTPSSDGEIVYALGAVFRTQRTGGLARTRPRIVAEEGTLLLPLVQTRSRQTQSLGGGTVRVGAERAGSVLLASSTDATYDRVFLNVTSPRAGLWERVLSEHEGLSCTLDTAGTTDRTWCVATGPQRVHVSVVRIDVTLSD